MSHRRLAILLVLGPVLGASMFASTSCGGDSKSDPDPRDAGGDRVAARPPSVSSVSVEGSAGRKIRQGSGEAPTNVKATVHVVGERLDDVSSVRVGPPGKQIAGEVVSNTSTQLVFRLSVPHGAPLGEQPIEILTAVAAASVPGVIISEIVAAPSGADADDAGSAPVGTDEGPVRSMQKAISLAGPGDTVLLTNGTYNRAGGDDFADPVASNPVDTPPNVPVGVTIRGESAGGVKLEGPRKSDCGAADGRVAFILAGDARIEQVEIFNFCQAVYAKTGTVTVRGAAVHDIGGTAITIAGNANATIEATNVHHTGSGVFVSQNAAITVKDSQLTDTGNSGIGINATGAVAIIGTEIARNRYDGILLKDTKPPSQVTIDRLSVHDNGGQGIIAAQTPSSPALSITNSIFTNASLKVYGGWSVALRGSSFDASGILIEGSPTGLDFGRKDSAGKNTFKMNYVAISDLRPAPTSGGSIPITVAGNTWIGSPGQAPLGCSAASHPPDPSNEKHWFIQNPGTCTSTGNVVINDAVTP